MRRHLLALLLVSILVPSLAVLVVSGVSLFQHERAMEAVARSYVEDLAQTVASRMEDGLRGSGYLSPTMRLMGVRLFTAGLSMPGWVAVVDAEGAVITASPGVEILTKIWRPEFPLGRAFEVRRPGEDTYTVAAYPVGRGFFVVAAVSWKQLLGPMVHFSHLWALLVGSLGVAGLLAVIPLWRWLVRPLRCLEEEVSTLQWGRDLPRRDDPVAVYQVRRLREVLHELARTAVDRVELTRRYVSDLVGVQERERASLAREIHDGPVQDVTALVQQIRLAKNATSAETRSRHFDLAEDGASMAVRELRALCDELAPPWLDLGLPQALTELTERFSRHFDVVIDCDVDPGLEDLCQEKVLSLFRIIQEGLNNAVRHGRARKIDVRLGPLSPSSWQVQIVDDGQGFLPPDDLLRLRLAGHRGLTNMEERARLIGGHLKIHSAPGEGTTIEVLFPADGRGEP